MVKSHGSKVIIVLQLLFVMYWHYFMLDLVCLWFDIPNNV